MTPPSHRKPPVKRAFTGLAGSPWSGSDIPGDSDSTPPKKIGRPASNGTAMTPAERKAKSRAAKSVKLADATRRGLAAKLLGIYKR